MDHKKKQSIYLNEGQAREKSFEIIELLEALPLGHALHVLEETKHLLLDCHVVDSGNDQFKMRASEHQESLISDSESHRRHHQ